VNRAVADAVGALWGVDVTAGVPLTGGEDSEVWRCGGHVLRVHPEGVPPEEVAWCQAWASAVAATVPEVLLPLRSRDGTTLAVAQGCVLEVVPFVPGEPLDPRDAAQRRQAVDLLVRLTDAADRLDLGERPGWGGLRWDEAGWTEASGLPDHELDDFWQGWSKEAAAGRRPLHADLQQGNLVVRDGRIVALLDHDDARVMHPLEELAYTAGELARMDGSWRLDRPLWQAVLADYAERTGVAVNESTVRALLRVQLRWWVGLGLHPADPDPADAVIHAALFGDLRHPLP